MYKLAFKQTVQCFTENRKYVCHCSEFYILVKLSTQLNCCEVKFDIDNWYFIHTSISVAVYKESNNFFKYLSAVLKEGPLYKSIVNQTNTKNNQKFVNLIGREKECDNFNFR